MPHLRASCRTPHHLPFARRRRYRVVGLPINETYTEIRPLIQRVDSTNIFKADSPGIQFVLTAYVHTYPNSVCSVWIYVASLEDLRSGNQPRLS